MRADLTLDVTVNTDFAQVEADEQQVNLTRFPLFFPEKRPFFLENAQIFQLGQPQAIDLFFSRRIGLSPSGQPIDILAGGRLSGKLGGYNVGLLNMQTDATPSIDRTGETIAPANNFTVIAAAARGRPVELRRDVRRTARASGDRAAADDYNRAYGLDLGVAGDDERQLFAFLARTDSPESKGGSDYAGRAFYTYANPLWTGSAAATRRSATSSTPRSAFCRGGRTGSSRAATTSPTSRSGGRGSAAFSRTSTSRCITDLENKLESSRGTGTSSRSSHRHGGRFGYLFETQQDRPRRAVYGVSGRDRPAGGHSCRANTRWTTGVFEGNTDPSAPISASLRPPDRDLLRWRLLRRGS